MKPLWEAAKNTVEGGIKELQEIITERRQKNDSEPETLKLEVVKRDLTILSMVYFKKDKKKVNIGKSFFIEI